LNGLVCILMPPLYSSILISRPDYHVMMDMMSNDLIMKLEDLGFTDWFQESLKKSQQPEYSLARVITVHKDNYRIRNEKKEIPAEPTGKLIYGAKSNLDLPTVGDWVYVQYFDKKTFAIIHEIFPRKSLLKRKVAGKRIEYQLVASNIEIAFIVQSAVFDFNLPRLERYLVMVNEGNIEPVILLSKRDLISDENLEHEVSEIKSVNPDYEIVAFSNKTGEGIDKIQKILRPGQTYCLLGTSGVGKTTLINKLIGKDMFATGAVREKNGKGRHVTASRQLIILEQGGMIIDTPGMRELGNIEISTGLNETFNDIAKLAQNCRFKDCTHIKEPGCSVITAVRDGELSEKLYQNYLKIRKESEFYQTTYLERRKKDKKFGKMSREAKEMYKKKI
jgi:ribosome biogenesis GTPase